jgi:hypothetical protein
MTLFVRSIVIFMMDAGTLLLIFSPKVLMLVHGVEDDGAQGADLLVNSLNGLQDRKRKVLISKVLASPSSGRSQALSSATSSEGSRIISAARSASRALTRVAPA